MSEAAIHKTWPSRLDELTSQHPDLTALVVTGENGGVFTWRDLSERSAGVATLFAHRGIAQGSVVCIQLPNCIAHVLSTLGAWRLGATVLPIRHDLPPPERARLLDLANAAVIVGETVVDERSMLADTIVSASATDPSGLPPSPVASPAWITASGGSTGHPKLIMPGIKTTLDAEGFNIVDGRSAFADNSRHRHPTTLISTPLGHTHGFATLYRTLLEDFRIVVMPKFDVEGMLDLIERERISFIPFVPTQLVRLLRSPTLKSRDLSSLERTMVGAGATPDWAIREWIAITDPTRFVVGYGASENVTSSFIRGDEWLHHPGSVGKPVNTEVIVVGEDGNTLPPGEVGELYFRPVTGQHAFRYLGKAEMRTRPGGYVSIGDLGWVDEDGYLYISDRRTDMVVTGGANVFVAEVEAALTSHPNVVDAVVIGLKDPEWSRRVHALIQIRPGADADATVAALPGHCKQMLAPYKVPRSYEIVADMGRTEAGKINRQALAKARED